MLTEEYRLPSPLPWSYTKGISNLAGEEHYHMSCHRLHTWHSRASCLRATGEAWKPADRKKEWSERRRRGILALKKMGKGVLLYRLNHLCPESPSLILFTCMDQLAFLNPEGTHRKDKGSLQQKSSWRESHRKAYSTVISKGFTCRMQWSPGLKGHCGEEDPEFAEWASQLNPEDHWVYQTKVSHSSPAKTHS